MMVELEVQPHRPPWRRRESEDEVFRAKVKQFCQVEDLIAVNKVGIIKTPNHPM
jgi:hypothetical protein